MQEPVDRGDCIVVVSVAPELGKVGLDVCEVEEPEPLVRPSCSAGLSTRKEILETVREGVPLDDRPGKRRHRSETVPGLNPLGDGQESDLLMADRLKLGPPVHPSAPDQRADVVLPAADHGPDILHRYTDRRILRGVYVDYSVAMTHGLLIFKCRNSLL